MKKYVISAIILALVLLIGKMANDKKNIPWDEKDESSLAYIMMQDHVKARLKSPASAQFAPYAGKVKMLDHQIYEITSHVDSQNSYGATLRSTFTGKIQQTSKDNWKLITLEMQ